jgi:membrane protease YdiL (CAAX protease family)
MPKDQSYIAFLSVILVISLVFIYFKYILPSRILNRGNVLTGFFLGKISGFLLFGMVPIIILLLSEDLSPAGAGFTSGDLSRYKLLVAAISIVVGLVTFFVTRMNSGLKKDGSVNISSLSFRNLIVIVSGWTIYILGYEFLFRGVLWFFCYSAFGFVPAIIINVIIYSLAHLGQGPLMSAGSVPVGIILCLLAHISGTFLFPFIIHTTMAVSYECFSAYHNLKFRTVS